MSGTGKYRYFSRIRWSFAVHVAANGYYFRSSSSSIEATYTFEFLGAHVQLTKQPTEGKVKGQKAKKDMVDTSRANLSMVPDNFMSDVGRCRKRSENRTSGLRRRVSLSCKTLSGYSWEKIQEQENACVCRIISGSHSVLSLISDEGRYRKVKNAFRLAKCRVCYSSKGVHCYLNGSWSSIYYKLPKTENKLEEAVKCSKILK